MGGTYKENNIGPKPDTWGTPYLTEENEET